MYRVVGKKESKGNTARRPRVRENERGGGRRGGGASRVDPEGVARVENVVDVTFGTRSVRGPLGWRAEKKLRRPCVSLHST